MAYVAYVGDRFGQILDQITVKFNSLAWRLNEIGQATMTVARSDDKATRRNLQYGNRILVDFDNATGLPNWGGVIEPPTVWTYENIEFTVYAIEYMLQYRQTPKSRMFVNATAGAIFTTLLREIEHAQSLGIEAGSVWGGGRKHSPKYHFEPIWNIISTDLHSKELCDVRFDAKLIDGKIRFKAHLFQKAGSDKSAHYALKEGLNVSKVRMTEQGPIVNEYAAAGAGSSWGDERQSSVFRSVNSVERYGLRQSSGIYSGVTQQSTIDRFARMVVKRDANPKLVFGLDVANVNPAKFVHYREGDELRLVLPSFGFNGYDEKVRVVSREYYPDQGVCKLVTEEVTDVLPIYIGTGADYMGELVETS